MTSPGLDAEPAMQDFVNRFKWPDTMVHAVDSNGELWAHFGVRLRGTWVMVNEDGTVASQSAGHISKEELENRLNELISS